ncbi:hypothetical protein [Clostridium beijerinckii]|uniref:Uncharacterized protein n=1 Tax=Clostridium beijerinckii TaxID=1520 RepID=A0A1S8S9S6_CLOBE|nr:hypothetical protein [Clostridium beijerinckii]NRY59836.1 hypothetical protein [Clostridium beijerinckii]OOM62191.1 hypothetical protein CLBCK_18940 [Clostridium beijerinckii]
MTNLIAFISKFEGIIGALMGVVATLITTQLIKSLGKIYFYFYDYNIRYYGEGELGEVCEIEDINRADYCTYRLRIQLYNSSEIIKVLNDIKIEFVLEDKSVFSKPNNEDNMIKHASYSEYKDFNFINIPPKELIEINITGSISTENIVDISRVQKIHFIAKNHKNKTIKKLIKSF